MYPHISKTLLSIQIDFNSAVVWIILIFPLISSFPSLFSSPLETVLSTLTTINIIVTFIFPTFTTLEQGASV